ncbi:MAG: hypothetical protein KDA84_10800, partial [Planctomycetaceae bacterium]|nr:hypothetical protein [Planctomycetaceae bacterium]
TDFSEPVAVATTNKQPDLPNTVAERMQMKVDAEFARRPLADALQYLCDEVHVNLHVDGDGLKDAGYTKNMPQTFNLGQVPMIQALAKIVNSYQERNKEMVACVDQDKMLITVTTRKFAEAQGLEIFPLPATPDE